MSNATKSRSIHILSQRSCPRAISKSIQMSDQKNLQRNFCIIFARQAKSNCQKIGQQCSRPEFASTNIQRQLLRSVIGLKNTLLFFRANAPVTRPTAVERKAAEKAAVGGWGKKHETQDHLLSVSFFLWLMTATTDNHARNTFYTSHANQPTPCHC